MEYRLLRELTNLHNAQQDVIVYAFVLNWRKFDEKILRHCEPIRLTVRWDSNNRIHFYYTENNTESSLSYSSNSYGSQLRLFDNYQECVEKYIESLNNNLIEKERDMQKSIDKFNKTARKIQLSLENIRNCN